MEKIIFINIFLFVVSLVILVVVIEIIDKKIAKDVERGLKYNIFIEELNKFDISDYPESSYKFNTYFSKKYQYDNYKYANFEKTLFNDILSRPEYYEYIKLGIERNCSIKKQAKNIFDNLLKSEQTQLPDNKGKYYKKRYCELEKDLLSSAYDEFLSEIVDDTNFICICEYISPQERNSYITKITINKEQAFLLIQNAETIIESQKITFEKSQDIRSSLSKKIANNKYFDYKTFEKYWITDSKHQKGLKYDDKSGCYYITIFDKNKGSIVPFLDYDDVYVGQSVNVYQRVYNHFKGKGNGDIYVDIKSGRKVFVGFIYCDKSKLNELEVQLIDFFNATNSYNKTVGGATKREGY